MGVVPWLSYHSHTCFTHFSRSVLYFPDLKNKEKTNCRTRFHKSRAPDSEALEGSWKDHGFVASISLVSEIHSAPVARGTEHAQLQTPDLPLRYSADLEQVSKCV